MSLASQIALLATRIGAEIKSVRAAMVTTSTAQAITGTKTYSAGTLLMTNGTITAEPYSDVNAPSSLEMTQIAGASVVNPTTGRAVLYSPDGASLLMKNPAGTITTIGPSAGGSGGTTGANYSLTTEYIDTQPATPTTGVTLFARNRARRMVSMVGPNGQDTALQPALFSNRVSRWGAVNGSATPSIDNMAVQNVVTPAAVSNSTGSVFNAAVRSRFATSSATAGLGTGVRTTTSQWFMTTTPNTGGFFFVARLGISAGNATSRGFVGLSATNAALSPTVDVSTMLNMIGFGYDAASSQWYFMTNNSSGTANLSPLGAQGFPCRTYGTELFEFRLFVPSGSATTVYWSAQNITTPGNTMTSSTTVKLPAANTMLSAHAHMSSGTTASIVSFDLQSLYIETDN